MLSNGAIGAIGLEVPLPPCFCQKTSKGRSRKQLSCEAGGLPRTVWPGGLAQCHRRAAWRQVMEQERANADQVAQS